MIDLHTHSIFSDGELIPSELIRRAEVKGLTAIALTDHADISNLDLIIPRIVKACQEVKTYWKIRAIPGIELTHIPPKSISSLAREARRLGAKLILVHGETMVEPVLPGTNRAAIEAKVDILAHPGLILDEDVELARKNSVCLEISARKGHCLTNGHVASLAKKIGAKLVLNTDAHSAKDLITREEAREVARGAGLLEGDFEQMQLNAEELIGKY
jgi:putative hydrolase